MVVSLPLYNIPYAIGAAFCFILFIVACVYHIKYRNEADYIRITKLVKILTFGVVVGFMACNLSLILYNYQFNAFADLFYGIGQGSTYILYLHISYYAIKGTSHQSSNRVYIMLYSLIGFYVILQIMLILTDFFRDISFINNNLWTELHLAQTILSCITDLTLSLSMLILFLKTLRSVGTETSSPRDHDHNIDKTWKLMDVVAKFTIISSLSLIFAQVAHIWIIINLAYLFITNKDKDAWNKRFGWGMEIMNVICSMVNSFCVLLFLPFFHSLYHCLFGKLHKRCKKWAFKKLDQLRINRDSHAEYWNLSRSDES